MAEPAPDAPDRLGDLTRGEHLLSPFKGERVGCGARINRQGLENPAAAAPHPALSPQAGRGRGEEEL